MRVDRLPHPITTAGRSSHQLAIREGDSICTALDTLSAAGCDMSSVFVLLNGQPIDSELWATTTISDGDALQVRQAMGDNGSDPLRLILAIGLAVIAPHIAAKLIGQSWAGATVTSVTGAGILGKIAYASTLVLGSLLIHAIAPPRLPERASNSRDATLFSILGGGNLDRQFQPLMLVLGRHRIFPDLVTKEYTEIIGENQVLSQVFDFGLGDLVITELKIGETALDSFIDVEKEFSLSNAGGPALTIAVGDVDTLAGGELTSPDEPIVRTTPTRTTHIHVDIVGQMGRYDDRGGQQTHSRQIEIKLSRPGIEEIHNADISGKPNKAVRQSIKITLPYPGRWDVAVRVTSAEIDNDRILQRLSVGKISAYEPDLGTYRGRNRMALTIRATGQLQGRIAQLSSMVGQRIPIWDGESWGDDVVESSNPAALLRWFAKGIYVDGEKVAGIGLPDSRIDHQSLGEWYERCERLNQECNYVLIGGISQLKVIETICQAGDADRSWATGKLGVVYADLGDSVSAFFGPGNTVAGSVSIYYINGGIPDVIQVRFVDPNNDWNLSTVRRAVPDASHSGQISTVTLEGVTNMYQAVAEANSIAAGQKYHNRRIDFELPAEGLSVVRGDVGFISSDLLTGGDSARLMSHYSDANGDVANAYLISREVLRSGGAGDHGIFRHPNGKLQTVELAARESDDPVNVIRLVADAKLDSATGENAPPLTDTLLKVYRAGLPPQKVRVISVEPSGNKFRISVTDEVDEFYTSGSLSLNDPLPNRPSRLPAITSATITESLVVSGNIYLVRFAATLTVSGDYRLGVIRAAYDGDETTIVATANSVGRAEWVGPAQGAMVLSITPGSDLAATGETFTSTHHILGKAWPPANVHNFVVAAQGDGTRDFNWSPVADVDLAGYQIRYSPRSSAAPWETMTPLNRGLLTSNSHEVNQPGAGDWSFAIKAYDSGGRESSAATYIHAELPDRRLGTSIYFDCPAEQGWPGTLTGGSRNHEPQSISGHKSYSWDDLGSWADWLSWSGDGVTAPVAAMVYTEPVIDLVRSLQVFPKFTATTSATVLFEYRAAATAAALPSRSWQQVGSSAIGGRFFELRWIIGSSTLGALAEFADLCITLQAIGGAEERISDVQTSQWQRGAGGGRLVPHGLDVVTGINLVLQNVGAGWSFTVLSKNPAEIAIYNAAGAIADALIDAHIGGIKA